MYGIKGFDEDLKCRGFQYEVGKTYEMAEEPILCSRGFHLCSSVKDVFTYYPKFWCNRYCVVEAVGEIASARRLCEGNGTLEKIATNKIRIVKEITNEIRLMFSSPGTIVGMTTDSANLATFDFGDSHVTTWMTMRIPLTYTGALDGIINKIIKDDESRKERE